MTKEHQYSKLERIFIAITAFSVLSVAGMGHTAARMCRNRRLSNVFALLSLVGIILGSVTLCGCGKRVEILSRWRGKSIGKIVFESDRSGNRDVWAMNEDGSNLKQLTNSTDNESLPSWSPDGSKIAYVNKTQCKLYVMDRDGANKTLLFTSPYGGEWHSPAKWSPDGTKLVFATDIAYNNVHVFTIDADGTDLRNLTGTRGINREPSWSVDGTKIVYQHREGGLSYTEEIYVMNSDGSDKTKITSGARNESTTKEDPEWAPHSSRILFSYGHNIATMNNDGSNITSLTNDAVYGSKQYQHPSWTPNLAKIVFDLYQTDGFRYDIWIMNSDGSNPTRLTQESGDDRRAECK